MSLFSHHHGSVSSSALLLCSCFGNLTICNYQLFTLTAAGMLHELSVVYHPDHSDRAMAQLISFYLYYALCTYGMCEVRTTSSIALIPVAITLWGQSQCNHRSLVMYCNPMFHPCSCSPLRVRPHWLHQSQLKKKVLGSEPRWCRYHIP